MKRKIIGLVLVMLVFCNIAFAMDTVNVKMVKEAQNFGVMSVSKSASELEKPWTFFNTISKHKKDDLEKIIVYTPYLVTALDAQNKTKSGGLINDQYGLVLAKNYENVLVVGAMLESKENLKANDIKVTIIQENKTIIPYYVIVDSSKKDYTVIDKRMSLTKAKKYKKKIDELESNKMNISREVEILSLSYEPILEEQKDIELKKDPEFEKDVKVQKAVNVKTKSIVLKKDVKENSFSEYLKNKQLEKVLKDKKDKNDESVIVREKNIKWQVDFLIYFDINEINKDSKIILQIKDSSENKRAFKFDLTNVK